MRVDSSAVSSSADSPAALAAALARHRLPRRRGAGHGGLPGPGDAPAAVPRGRGRASARPRSPRRWPRSPAGRADPAAVLRGPRGQPGALRLGLPAASCCTCAPPRRRACRRDSRRRWRRRSTTGGSCSPGRCCRRWRTRPACCWSTRSTAPTTSSRRSCSRCWPTSRSPSRAGHDRAPTTPPLVVLTSNRTREVHDALKRRCLYHWLEHPDFEREVAILRAPAARGHRAAGRARSPRDGARLRDAGPAQAAGRRRVDGLGAGAARARRPATSTPTAPRRTLGAVLKYREDTDRVQRPAGRAAGADAPREPDVADTGGSASPARCATPALPASPDRVDAFLTRGGRPRGSSATQVYWAGRLTLCARPRRPRPLRRARSPPGSRQARFRRARSARGRPAAQSTLLAAGAGGTAEAGDGGPQVARRPAARGRGAAPPRPGRADASPSASTCAGCSRCCDRPPPTRRPGAAARAPRRRRSRAGRVRAALRDGGELCGCCPARRAPGPRRRGAAGRRVRLDGALRRRPAALRPRRRAPRARVDRGVHARHPADPGHPRAAPARPRRALRGRRRGHPRLVAAAPGSARCCRRSSTAGASAARPAAPSSWCSPTAGSAATPPCSASSSARLRRLAHRVVWVNPHMGKAGYAPVQGGMRRRAAVR